MDKKFIAMEKKYVGTFVFFVQPSTLEPEFTI